MIQLQEKGIYKVVDASQLESWTSAGWRLVAVLENQTQIPWSDTENFPLGMQGVGLGQPQFNQYGNPGGFITGTSTRYHDVKSQSFLIFQDEESVIAKLNAEVAARDEKIKLVGDVEKKLGDTLKELGTEREALQKLTVEINNLKAELKAEAGKLFLANQTHEAYKLEVAERAKQADEIIERDSKRRRTAYERVAEGGYDDGVESLEERDAG